MLFAQNKYGRYCVPDASAYRFASQAVLAGRVHEPDTIEFIIQATRPGATVVHAGAFFGDFLPALHSAGLEVIAFEPNPESWLHAVGTLHLNHILDLPVHNAALGAEKGSAGLVTVENALPLWGGSYIAQGDEGNVSCALCRLDDVVSSFDDVAVIHLDVEQYEKHALQGALLTIRRCRPILILETVPQEWVDRHLAPLGYTETGTVHHNTIFTP